MKATEAELRRVLAEAAFCAGYGFELGSVADGECTLDTITYIRTEEGPRLVESS